MLAPLTASWTGYVVYDATSRQVLAVYGNALMEMAFDKRDEIAAAHPLAYVMAERLECAKQPHVGDFLTIAGQSVNGEG